MKLNALLEAFAGEVEQAQPRMQELLTQLQTLSADSDEFLNALDDFSSQSQRMGEAAEMVGFPGLQTVCNHIVDNTLLLVTLQPAERDDVIAFLTACPQSMLHYLRHFEDPSTAAGLVDLLRFAPSPLETEQALKVTYQLGEMSIKVSQPAGGDDDNARPIIAKSEDVVISVPENAEPSLMDGFFQEAPEQTRYLVQLSQNMVSGDGDISDITAAKRVAHTLKGSGAVIGIRGLTTISHHLEDILEFFEENDGQIITSIAQTLLNASYCLEQIVNYLAGEDEKPLHAQLILQDLLDIANRIDRGDDMSDDVKRVTLSDIQAQEATTTTNAPVQSATPSGSSSLRVDMERIEEMFRISGEVMTQGTAIESRVKALTQTSKQLQHQNTKIYKRLFELQSLVDTRALSMMHSGASDSDDFDALEMDEYNELHSASNALMEETSDIRAYINEIDKNISSINGLHIQQQQLLKDMQFLVLSTRMTAVSALESRLQRNVRNTCQATQKSVTMQLHGGDTLIDSNILNRFAEPLMHMLRNAIDHGIESPEERLNKGKPETGTISLTFSRQGQQVVLVCQDDGKGLDPQKIYQQALEKGLITEHQQLTESEILRLILQSGFSTKDAVSEISGRGVGMDVVREWVQNLNGSISVSSEPGSGARFELRFPASLSTMQSLVVTVDGQHYALPYTYVLQALTKGLGRFEKLDTKWVFHYDQQSIPVLPLAQLVGKAVDTTKLLSEYNIVIVSVNDQKYALAVDELIDARDLLVKTPKRYASQIQGVSGMSILGDGSITINLDLAALIHQSTAQPRMARKTVVKQPQQKQTLPSVMIVDDALSIRNSLRTLIEDAGYTAKTARDGMEAVDMLNAEKPEIVLTDLEMPNMNGVDLTSYIRNQDNLKDLPVIMITSRSQEKHRTLAQNAGVDEYLTKPYDDDSLLMLIRQHLSKTA